ncbi:MAG: hypothetical protein RLZZ210_1033 [Pseudomonadota bacterium]|jgi:soluble lytic murein transglycosylase
MKKTSNILTRFKNIPQLFKKISFAQLSEYSINIVICLAMTTVSAQMDINTTGSTPDTSEMSLPLGFNSALDGKFLALKAASKRGDIDATRALSLELSNYDIPSYVDYYRLYPLIMDRNGVPRTDFPDAEIRQFLIKYTGEAIADRMRNDWLLAMGKKGDWDNFLLEYPKFVLKDDTQLACYNLIAQISAGKDVGEQAKEVLADTKKYGVGCVQLIDLLYQKKQLTQTDLKLYAVIATEKKQGTLARQIYSIIQATDDSLIRLVETAQRDYRKAVLDFERFKYGMGEVEQAMVWGTIAYAAAQNLSPDALEFYNMSARLTPANVKVLSPLSFEWRVRMALRTNNWALVKTYIEEMPNFVRKRDNTTGYLSTVWDYWLARSYAERGDRGGANRIFTEVAQKTDFYGQLAVEELGKLITLTPPVIVTQEEVAKISHRKGIQQSKRFFDMNMRDEGRREWNWETRFMSDKELIAMAEIGVKLDMMDRAIYSADKTKEQHNFNLRYPTPMIDVLHSAADKAKVDLAFVYGLTRQESRFIKSAKSGVGASGLMQVMPATGAWVAQKLGMPWPKSKAEARDKLADINVNTILGAAYIGMVLADLDYHYGMAAAAYNAGPSRPKKWRAMLTQQIDGAAYAESIPFAETRDYVKNVLSNTVYYRALMSGQPQSLKNLVATIAPKEEIQSELP